MDTPWRSLEYLALPFNQGACMCCCCPCMGWTTKTLHLQGEEVFYKTKTAGYSPPGLGVIVAFVWFVGSGRKGLAKTK